MNSRKPRNSQPAAKRTTKGTARKSKPKGKRLQRHHVLPRTLEALGALPAPSREAYTRSLHALAKMRSEGLSLYAAAKEVDVDPRTVLRWGKAALRKQKSGRFTAKRSDQMLRVLMLPSKTGAEEIAVRGSRAASDVARYWAAVHEFLSTGDSSGLTPFDGEAVPLANGSAVPFLTALESLEELGSAGVLSFESLYARSN